MKISNIVLPNRTFHGRQVRSVVVPASLIAKHGQHHRHVGKAAKIRAHRLYKKRMAEKIFPDHNDAA